MNICLKRKKTGFTLLEILVVVAILSILAAIVIAAINPGHQMSMARDAARRNDVSEISKAVSQYYIDHQAYPFNMPHTGLTYEICNRNTPPSAGECINLVDVTKLVPTYTADIPADPSVLKGSRGTGYYIATDPNTGIYVEAPNTENSSDPNKLVIFVGRAPEGYTIPSVYVPVETSKTFVENIQESVVTLKTNYRDWFAIAGICSTVALFISYLVYRRRSKKYGNPGSSLLNKRLISVTITTI